MISNPKPILCKIKIVNANDHDSVLKDLGLHVFADERDKKVSINYISNDFFHETKNLEFEVQVQEVEVNYSSYMSDCFATGIRNLQEHY